MGLLGKTKSDDSKSILDLVTHKENVWWDEHCTCHFEEYTISMGSEERSRSYKYLANTSKYNFTSLAISPKTAPAIWQRPRSDTRSMRWFTKHLSFELSGKFELPQSNLKSTMSVAPVIDVIKWKLSSTHWKHLVSTCPSILMDQ